MKTLKRRLGSHLDLSRWACPFDVASIDSAPSRCGCSSSGLQTMTIQPSPRVAFLLRGNEQGFLPTKTRPHHLMLFVSASHFPDPWEKGCFISTRGAARLQLHRRLIPYVSIFAANEPVASFNPAKAVVNTRKVSPLLSFLVHRFCTLSTFPPFDAITPRPARQVASIASPCTFDNSPGNIGE